MTLKVFSTSLAWGVGGPQSEHPTASHAVTLLRVPAGEWAGGRRLDFAGTEVRRVAPNCTSHRKTATVTYWKYHVGTLVVAGVCGRQLTHVPLKYTTRFSEAGSSVPRRASPQIISRTLLFQCSHPPMYPPEVCSFLATISWENLCDTLSPMRQTPGTTPLSLAGPLPLLPVHFTSIHARPSLLVSCPLH